MKRLLLTVLFCGLAGLATSQTFPPDAEGGGGGGGAPDPHATTHEDGGADEIDLGGLSAAARLFLADGTDSAPSFGPTSDTDVGCHFPAVTAMQCQSKADAGGLFSQFSLSASGAFLYYYDAGLADTSVSVSSIEQVTMRANGDTLFTLNDTDGFTFYDTADPTKGFRFVLSGITASTVRTFTVPDANTRAFGLPTSLDGSVVVTDNTSTFDIGDAGIYPLYSTNAGTPSTCTDGREIIDDSTNDRLYWCSDTDTPLAVVTPASTDTLTNKTFDANGTGNSLSNVDVADLADGTDGELITWDASGNAATVAAGTSGQVLTSNGAGAAPTFQNAAGGGLGFAFVGASIGGTIDASSTRYLGPGGVADQASESNAKWVMPATCTARNFYFNLAAVQGDGTLVMTIRDDGAGTAVTFTIAATAAAGVYSDTSNTASIAAGSLVSVQAVNNATAASQWDGWGFQCN